MWQSLENKLFAYADNAALLAVISSPQLRTEDADSLNRDPTRIFEWCKLWGMKLNPTKTQSMIVIWSRIPHPLHPHISIDGTVLSTVILLRF